MKKFIMSVAIAGAFLALPAISEASFSMGDRGTGVEQLQESLASKGYNSNSNIDGVFGPKTRAAVQAFQLSNGISNPRGNFFGVAGPATLSSIGITSSSSRNSGSASNATSTSSSSSITASATSNSTGVISTARSAIGSPYRWGGTTTAGFDCSGFVQYAFAKNGKSLPRTVAQMWSQGTSVSNPQPGDLVFFETRTGPSHAGIYLGNNQFIHSGSSTGVTISNMNSSYWGSAYLGAKRF